MKRDRYAKSRQMLERGGDSIGSAASDLAGIRDLR